MTPERTKEQIKRVILELLNFLPPDQQASAFEEVAVGIRSRLARDTQPVPIPELPR